MQRLAKQVVSRALKSLGIGVTRYETLEMLRRSTRCAEDMEFLREVPKEFCL